MWKTTGRFDSYIVTVNMMLSKTEVVRPAAAKRAKEFPIRYGQLKTTPLKVTVETEPTDLPAFELDSKAKQPLNPAIKKGPKGPKGQDC